MDCSRCTCPQTPTTACDVSCPGSPTVGYETCADSQDFAYETCPGSPELAYETCAGFPDRPSSREGFFTFPDVPPPTECPGACPSGAEAYPGPSCRTSTPTGQAPSPSSCFPGLSPIICPKCNCQISLEILPVAGPSGAGPCPPTACPTPTTTRTPTDLNTIVFRRKAFLKNKKIYHLKPLQ
uniref:Uncharacterized protein n=1 Tax=Graphocephala atropunctata TaxID=36148 RepID=A0A1B6KX13_9HEMI